MLHQRIENKKERKLQHSQDLVRELQNIKDSKIDFSSDNTDLKLYVKPDFSDCSKMVKAHLRDTTYKEICDTIERRNFYINKLHNAELQELSDKLISDIMSKVKEKISNKIDESRPESKQTRYFTGYFSLEIIPILRHNYRNQRTIFFNHGTDIRENKTVYILSIDRPLVVSDDEKEIQDIEKIIKNRFDDAVKSNSAKLLSAYLEEIMILHKLIIDKLSDVIIEVESGELLKGHCDLKICRS